MPVSPDHRLFVGWHPMPVKKTQGQCPRSLRVPGCHETLLHRDNGLAYQVGEIDRAQLKGEVACLPLGQLEEAINHPCQASARLCDSQEEFMAFLTRDTALMA